MELFDIFDFCPISSFIIILQPPLCFSLTVIIRCHKKLTSDIEIPSGLKELEAREENLEILTLNTMQEVCRLTNPREFSKEHIIEIYK